MIKRKAFTLAEMAAGVLLLGGLTLLIRYDPQGYAFEHYHFMDDYLLSQSTAMAADQKYDLKTTAEYAAFLPIYFTADGTVNRSQSIAFPRSKVIIHLGNGQLTYE